MRRALGWSADDVLAKINDAAHDDDEGNVEFDGEMQQLAFAADRTD